MVIAVHARRGVARSGIKRDLHYPQHRFFYPHKAYAEGSQTRMMMMVRGAQGIGWLEMVSVVMRADPADGSGGGGVLPFGSIHAALLHSSFKLPTFPLFARSLVDYHRSARKRLVERNVQ